MTSRRMGLSLSSGSELVLLWHLLVSEYPDDGSDAADGIGRVVKLEEQSGLLGLVPETVVDKLHEGVDLVGCQIADHFGLGFGRIHLA